MEATRVLSRKAPASPVVDDLAADVVGPTKMDRPEDVEPSRRTGKIYAALTTNTDRGKPGKEAGTEVNPRLNNKHGHVLEITESRGDHTSTRFAWKLLLLCGDPAAPDTYFAGYDKSQVSPISCPDNVAFDSRGNLWISTDGNALSHNDGLFAVPVDGPERGHVKQFLTVPHGAETCGPVVTEDFVLVSVQYPGEAPAPTTRCPTGQTAATRSRVPRWWRCGGHAARSVGAWCVLEAASSLRVRVPSR